MSFNIEFEKAKELELEFEGLQAVKIIGKSAYEIWLQEGNVGTEKDFLDSLKGYTPQHGIDYHTDAEIQAFASEIMQALKEDMKAARIGSVTLLASAWKGESNLFSQVVEIEGVTENSQVDLTPDVQQLATFYEKDLSFVTENYNGVVTVYAIGQKPANDYTIQVTITEVAYE